MEAYPAGKAAIASTAAHEACARKISILLFLKGGGENKMRMRGTLYQYQGQSKVESQVCPWFKFYFLNSGRLRIMSPSLYFIEPSAMNSLYTKPHSFSSSSSSFSFSSSFLANANCHSPCLWSVVCEPCVCVCVLCPVFPFPCPVSVCVHDARQKNMSTTRDCEL